MELTNQILVAKGRQTGKTYAQYRLAQHLHYLSLSRTSKIENILNRLRCK